MPDGLTPSTQPTRVGETEYPFRFSVCTLVTRREQYDRMLETFRAAGFGPDRCEFLYVDNTRGNVFDAYQAFNLFLRRARGRYVIVCHQDVELIHDDVAALDRRIAELDALDPRWAVLGNAGGIDLAHRAVWISDGEGRRFYSEGSHFPQRVVSLDENFILVKSEANLAVSSDLSGFHLYGTDICLIAEILGFNAYVVAFHLYHRSVGTVDEAFHRSWRELRKKYRRALRDRYIRTTLTRFHLSGSRLSGAVMGTGIAQRLVRFYQRWRARLARRG
ncbi:MAG TPA: hypothetical protein VLT47_12375 [Anaeromyxobacteraceae bacterium]|nr:hypothetical protein [Anaeromyxobacteraceae bacterium]